MKVLVIDTALGACTVGVFDDNRRLAATSELMSKGHSERIGGIVRDVVAEAGPALGGFEALDRIGVTVGPGSFTGLRVGLAFALGLGGALDIPVVGISTLAALARSADGGAGPTAALIDARRGQAYVQTFRDGHAEIAPEAMALDDMRALLRRNGVDWRLSGSSAALVDPEAVVPDDHMMNPTVEALAALTLAADPDTAPPTPLYLRAPDATPPTRLPGQPRLVVARP